MSTKLPSLSPIRSSYTPSLQIEELSTPLLNHLPKFQELKNALISYFLPSNGIPAILPDVRMKSNDWKRIFFTSLLALMQELVKTTKVDIQTRFLEKIYN